MGHQFKTRPFDSIIIMEGIFKSSEKPGVEKKNKLVKDIFILRSRRLASPALLPLRFSSFHGSYEYGISAPLQSRKDIDKIEPFRRHTEPPIISLTQRTQNDEEKKKMK